jgi:enoyl-CoA hydratase
MTDEVICRVEGRVGRITLNRPGALHALTTAMCKAMIQALVGWRDDETVQAVLIDHSGERGFCAGGDIRMLADSGAGDGAQAREFFFTEYRLNHLLFTYDKPVVAVMDGVTMGGGVGISMPARFRIATERTTFAMPETGIGLFPDVGGGWHLPRLPGKTGLWLALTGARIKAADCLALGIATDFEKSENLEAVKATIVAEPENIEAVLARTEADPGQAPIAVHRDDIDRLFAGHSVESIFEALEADGGDWAKAQLEILKTKSPQTMKVSLRLLYDGRLMATFADEMAREYAVAAHVVQRHDFIEGVRAVIVDKDNAPQWNPATPEDVTEHVIDQIFAPLPDDEAWTPS